MFFLGIFAAYYIAKLPRVLKGVLDVILTLPMVLPPTVVGYFLLLLFGAKRPLGIFFMEHFGVKLVMNWYSAIFASIVVAFPLMYRTARGAFESFDETLAWSAQTLGLSNTWIFWRVRMPYCRQGILAGTVLAFARALEALGVDMIEAGFAGSSQGDFEAVRAVARTVQTGVCSLARCVEADIRAAAEALVQPFLPEASRREGLPLIFYMFTDMKTQSTDLMFYGHNAEEIIRDAFHVEPEGNIAKLPGVVSRKKQLIPPLLAALQARQ